MNGKPPSVLDPTQRIFYIGSGASMGLALGFIFGLLLFHDLGIAIGVGAAIGLVVAAAVDFRTGRA